MAHHGCNVIKIYYNGLCDNNLIACSIPGILWVVCGKIELLCGDGIVINWFSKLCELI